MNRKLQTKEQFKDNYLIGAFWLLALLAGTGINPLFTPIVILLFAMHRIVRHGSVKNLIPAVGLMLLLALLEIWQPWIGGGLILLLAIANIALAADVERLSKDYDEYVQKFNAKKEQPQHRPYDYQMQASSVAAMGTREGFNVLMRSYEHTFERKEIERFLLEARAGDTLSELQKFWVSEYLSNN